jgi:hypothetical protein
MQQPTEATLAYEAPRLTEIGTVQQVTKEDFCLWKKAIGPPDYVNWIPITNCSS